MLLADWSNSKSIMRVIMDKIKTTKIKTLFHKLKSYWSTPPEGEYLTIKEMGAYGIGGMGVSFIMNMIFIAINAELIPYFYQIDIIHGRNIFTLVTIINLIAIPLLGKFLDNTRTKWGKFKPFIIVLTPILGLLVIMACFIPQFDSETARIIYAYLTSVPVIVLSTFWFNVYNMIPAAMTPNTQERVKMLSPVGIVSSLAPTILLFVVGPMRKYFYNQGAEYLAFRYLSIITVIIGVVLTYLIVFYTKERVYITDQQHEKIPFVQGMKKVMKNKPFLIWCLAAIFLTLRMLIIGNMTFIANAKFSANYGEGVSILSLLSPLTGFGALPAMIITPFLTKKFNKKTILIASAFISFALLGVLMIIGFENIPVGVPAIVLMTLVGFFNNFITGVAIVLTPAITADMYDYQQYLTGERIEGFMGGFGAWITGIGTALILYIPTIIQRNIGFNVNLPQFNTELIYESANMAIANKWFDAVVIISFICTALWIIIMLFYKLTKSEHGRIMDIIKERAVASTFDDKENTGLEIVEYQDIEIVSRNDTNEENENKDE